ncbi:50S ribosomal protein L6 [Candidatus Babela massiliensis]|uniref:50S ribosomal protein L6 n=1 Tax=Candidatus Babela massiliensis TaxID=673862 RepID=V6DHT9_9BACT|nr:50S ribosomal protein L6 [Candidatus Babela massiliensis]CDK30498.1 Ribosomal protein L6 [Candidatus Babela massiliensis]
MSKIGRKPIDIGNTQVEVKDNKVYYKGKLAEGIHELPEILVADLKDKNLYLTPNPKKIVRDTNMFWGLHRALVANKIKGSDLGFEKVLRINGLGYKAVLTGSKIQFSLGYSHKIDFELPSEVKLEIDKSGQVLTFKSPHKDLLGQVCSNVRALRPPEPYKGTGIKYETEVILRKIGKKAK